MKTRARKTWTDTVETVQNQYKQVEKLWNDAFGQMNVRLQGVEKDAREFVQKVERDGRERLQVLKGQLPLETLADLLDGADFREQGARLRQETIDRLGLGTTADLTALGGKLDKLTKKVETVRRKANDAAVAKKDVKALERRIKKLETSLAKLQTSAKKAPAKKATTKKATTKKAAAKKA